MNAVRLHAYGDVDQFRVDDVPIPTPGAAEVLIRVAASAVNHFDLYVRQGYVAQMFPLVLPAVTGGDAAGTVAALGPGVTAFAVGDRVIAHLTPTTQGAHAEYLVAPVLGVARLPDGLTFEQGASLPFVGLTGRQVVDVLNVTRGARVLVAGALSGTGRVAVQYLRELGAVPVAGVRRETFAEARTVANELLDITETPLHASFDYAIVAAPAAAANTVRHVRDGGTIGAVGAPPADLNPLVTFTSIRHHDDPAVLQAVADAAGRGDLVIPIDRTFTLDDLAKAHAALAAGPRGKIVLSHQAM